MNELVTFPLSLEDQELVEAASSLIVRRAEYGQHHVASALRTVSGKQFLGLHLSANFGVGSICAEAAAIAEALKQEACEIDRIVSVRHTFAPGQATEVVPPCGRCRELIFEHGPNAFVIVSVTSTLVLVSIAQLLPLPFRRMRKNVKDPIIKENGR